jgi:mercuric ion binding protein
MKQAKIFFVFCLALFIVSCKNHENKEQEETKIDGTTGITTSNFKVWGNCEMCQETIEGALKMEGVAKSSWNKDTKIISVSYYDKKITLDQIQKSIAAAGYDNEKYKGDDSAYKALPECCQYERK